MDDLREATLKIDNKLFVMYFGLLLSLFANSLVFYSTIDSAASALIVGMVLVITNLILSL